MSWLKWRTPVSAHLQKSGFQQDKLSPGKHAGQRWHKRTHTQVFDQDHDFISRQASAGCLWLEIVPKMPHRLLLQSVIPETGLHVSINWLKMPRCPTALIVAGLVSCHCLPCAASISRAVVRLINVACSFSFSLCEKVSDDWYHFGGFIEIFCDERGLLARWVWGFMAHYL